MKQIEKFTKGKNKIIIAIVIATLIIGGFLLSRKNSNSDRATNQMQEEALPETENYPTVDASVIVDLKADRLKREVTLSINGIPDGTNSIDYELSYLAQGDLPKGVIGTIETNGESTVKKTGITLGTCSSGACQYDKGVKSIKVSLKFNNPDGAKIFEKEFDI